MCALLFLLYLLIGSVAGILSGMLGIGGGIITVPCFLALFYFLDYPEGYIMHMAVATSLATMIFNTLSATWAHHARGAVIWGVLKKMAPGLAFGSIAGAILATFLSTEFLERLFGIFLCALGVYFLYKKNGEMSHYRLPSFPVLSGLSFGIGTISNLLGIGGGTLTVPLLNAFSLHEKKAIGTSAATTLLLTIVGTLCYLALGWKTVDIPGNFGYVNSFAFLSAGVASFVMAPFGVKLTHQCSTERVRKLFAICLLLTGISMFIY